MSDIVEKLRKHPTLDACAEAAVAIERLTRERDEAQGQLRYFGELHEAEYNRQSARAEAAEAELAKAMKGLELVAAFAVKQANGVKKP